MMKILVTGAFGQIGSELTKELRTRYGRENVLSTGRKIPKGADDEGPCGILDVTNAEALSEVIRDNDINVIYHLAAILSASGEKIPEVTWETNINGLRHVLEAARQVEGCRLFWPSSIAVFGPDSPRDQTPQDTVMRPRTIYGVTKVTGELLCDYYCHRYDLDVRGVRYPGVISSVSPPGGGTTDYAVSIFHEALRHGRYTAFVREDCVLPMIYMPDCINAAIQLMTADRSKLKHRNSFNVAAMSFSAGELAAEIKKHLPGFVCDYQPDERQRIADSWPRSLDDRAARQEWGWKPEFDLASTTADMLAKLRESQIGAH